MVESSFIWESAQSWETFHLSKLVFECQASISEGRDDVWPVVYDENPNIDVTAVRDDAALPEPA